MRPFTETIAGVLERSPNAIQYNLGREAARHFDGWAVFETSDSDFDPVTFADDGQCALFVDHGTHAELSLTWVDDKVKEDPVTALFEALWLGHRLRLVRVRIESECKVQWIVASEKVTVLHAFFEAVCRWNADDRGDILVFRHGYWQRDKKLIEQISSASLDTLVARPGFIDELRRESIGFFASEDVYQRYGMAWKRGVLLLGPPGNGKTHAIKGLVRESKKPCLYVRNLESQRATLQMSIERVFHRARQKAPCILIFEDLDSMVTDKTRSVFLNELDGFASNNGVLVIATANYPEKLDPAILERPSRFDRKVMFALPETAERLAFLQHEVTKWEEASQPSADDLQEVAANTENFSFAYLKELCLSALIEWLRTGVSMAECLRQQTDVLRKQMRTSPTISTPAIEDDDDE